MPRKKKTTEATKRADMAAPIAASAANGKQTRMQVDMRDVVRKHAEHDVPRPMGEAAFRVAAAQSAREHNKIKAIEAEIEDFAKGKRMVLGEERPSRKDEIKALKESSAKLDREIEAEAHLILTPCIELHDVNRGIVTIYTDDNGEPGEKVKERRMTPEERKRAEEASPFEPPDGPAVTLDDDDSGAPVESYGDGADAGGDA